MPASSTSKYEEIVKMTNNGACMNRNGTTGTEKVPIMHGPRCLELAGPQRLLCLLKGPNVEVIRRRKDHKIVELQIHEVGDDSMELSRGGNASTNSHNKETVTNPPRCWTFRRLRKAS